MSAATKALYIEQGATFVLGFVWAQESLVTPNTPGDPYDLTDCTARMQIRKAVGTPVLLEATTENGKIAVAGLEGRVALRFEDEDTDTLDLKTAVYDLEVEFPGGDVYRLLQGKVTISPNVTRTP